MTRFLRGLVFGALLVSGPLVGGSLASAMVCGGGYSTTESNHTVFEHTCYEYYFNNAGSALSSGSVVAFDLTGTGVNVTQHFSASRSDVDVNGSDGDVENIGTYITTTTTADDELVAGVIDDDSCANQSYCRVQVHGPRLVRCLDASDAVGTGTSVSTSGTAGVCGDAANDADGNLGVALQAGNGSDDSPIWVWIRLSATD